jgi:hypothetical protein
VESIGRINLIAAIALSLFVAFVGWHFGGPSVEIRERTVVVPEQQPQGDDGDVASSEDGAGPCTASDRLDCGAGDDFDDGDTDEMPIQSDSFPI